MATELNTLRLKIRRLPRDKRILIVSLTSDDGSCTMVEHITQKELRDFVNELERKK